MLAMSEQKFCQADVNGNVGGSTATTGAEVVAMKANRCRTPAEFQLSPLGVNLCAAHAELFRGVQNTELKPLDS